MLSNGPSYVKSEMMVDLVGDPVLSCTMAYLTILLQKQLRLDEQLNAAGKWAFCSNGHDPLVLCYHRDLCPRLRHALYCS